MNVVIVGSGATLSFAIDDETYSISKSPFRLGNNGLHNGGAVRSAFNIAAFPRCWLPVYGSSCSLAVGQIIGNWPERNRVGVIDPGDP